MTAPVDTRESVEAMAATCAVLAAPYTPDSHDARTAAMLRRLLDRTEAAEAALATARADALREAADLLTRIAAEADAREPGGGPFGLVARYAENTRALAGDILALIHPTTTGET